MERRKKRRRLIELCKDILIVLLALSAVYLTMRTQIGGLAGWEGGWLSGLFSGKPVGLLPVQEETNVSIQPRPVRMSVQLGSGGRYGVQYDQTAVDALFDATASLLGDALGSAQEPVQVTEAAWRNALSNAWGIYFDFRGTVPLTVLSSALSGGAVNQALPEEGVRRLLLAEEDGAVRLYYSNESTGLYYACDTAEALRGHVQTAAAAYSPNGTVFAYETSYTELAPYVMVAATEAAPKVYHASNPVAQMSEADREGLMESLGFHPQSNNSYRSGDRLIVSEWPDPAEYSGRRPCALRDICLR